MPGMTTPKSETAPADQGRDRGRSEARRDRRLARKTCPDADSATVPPALASERTFPASRDNRPSYIEKALRSWKAGDRKNDPMGVMANVANKLTDDQIKSVAAYYESLPVAAPAHSPETKP